jgi:hypothetical protein
MTVQEEPALASPTTAAATSSTTLVEVDDSLSHLRDLGFAYWEAFNAHDVDLVLSYLEPVYRSEREETIQDEIGRLATFGVKLDLSELDPPEMTGADRAEMFLEMREPLGTRRIRMGFVLVEGAWLINYAQESE